MDRYSQQPRLRRGLATSQTASTQARQVSLPDVFEGRPRDTSNGRGSYSPDQSRHSKTTRPRQPAITRPRVSPYQDRTRQDLIPMSRSVFQVIDGTETFLQVPATVTAKNTGKTYNVLHRIRVQTHEQGRCQCRASKTGCGRTDYIAEFYIVADHYTKITPVVIAQCYAKGSKKDGTKQYLSSAAKIVTATVDDTSVDSPTHPPLE